MNLKNISIKNYSYTLAEENIAKYPLAQRDASRLLIYKEGKMEETIYQNVAEYVPEESLLVFNNSKVIEARLIFQKASGAVIEIFCLEPYKEYNDVTTGMMQQGRALWKCFIGGASKWKRGQLLQKKIQSSVYEITLSARYIEKIADAFVIEMLWQPSSFSFVEILHFAGVIPLPPYIKRNVEASDAQRYQTIYAEPEGSVAAPTAGLHFTNEIFETFRKKKINSAFITLHVGAGTFKPVKAITMDKHEMHSEFIEVSIPFIELLLANTNKTIISIGTTSLRTMESLYWLGVKLMTSDNNCETSNAYAMPELKQWEMYDLLPQNIAVSDALHFLLRWMKDNKMPHLIAKTKIIILPGYKIRIANAVITNFHQPQSTLLLLIAALIGEDWRKIYDYALQNNFRFLSYGRWQFIVDTLENNFTKKYFIIVFKIALVKALAFY